VSESAEVVVRLVAEILEAPGPGDVPEALAEVGRFQSAARRIIEADLPAEDEQRLLYALYGLARDTAELVELAIAGIDWELAAAADVTPIPSAGWVGSQRRLRAAGFECCPLCDAKIATEGELRRYLQRLREAAR
jgi:hypothetical protein